MSRLIKVKTDHASKGVIRMNKEKFLRCAVAHLENELSATKKELAELREVINKLPSRNSANLVNEIYNAIEQAKAFTQAKEQSE